MPQFLHDGPADAPVRLLLAHGAGAPMDSAGLTAAAQALAAEGIGVARFEFGYMAARRQGGGGPPPRAETVMPEYVAWLVRNPTFGLAAVSPSSTRSPARHTAGRARRAATRQVRRIPSV